MKLNINFKIISAKPYLENSEKETHNQLRKPIPKLSSSAQNSQVNREGERRNPRNCPQSLKLTSKTPKLFKKFPFQRSRN